MARKTSSVTLDGDMRFVGRVGSGHSIVLDSASGDTGPRPAALIPLAVAGCTAMDVIWSKFLRTFGSPSMCAFITSQLLMAELRGMPVKQSTNRFSTSAEESGSLSRFTPSRSR